VLVAVLLGLVAGESNLRPATVVRIAGGLVLYGIVLIAHTVATFDASAGGPNEEGFWYGVSTAAACLFFFLGYGLGGGGRPEQPGRPGGRDAGPDDR
jgi:hypothetical protein